MLGKSLEFERVEVRTINPTEPFGSTPSRNYPVIVAMHTTHDSPPRRRIGARIVTWLVIGLVVSSLIVIPLLVFGLGTYGWQTSLGLSTTAVGAVAMLPGVLLGLASLLVMLGSA